MFVFDNSMESRRSENFQGTALVTECFTKCLRLEPNNLSFNLPFEDPLEDNYICGQRLRDTRISNYQRSLYCSSNCFSLLKIKMWPPLINFFGEVITP
jgi:hypothetical protein